MSGDPPGRGRGRRRPGSATPGYFRKRGRLWEAQRQRQRQQLARKKTDEPFRPPAP